MEKNRQHVDNNQFNNISNPFKWNDWQQTI